MVASARSVDYGNVEEVILLYLVTWPSALMCIMGTQVVRARDKIFA
jgi:hypothetical protein